MLPEVIKVLLVWLIPISIELLIVWFFVATVKRAERRTDTRVPNA